jgi:RNA 2',3'-cyclic 3'-phosphodiesterase
LRRFFFALWPEEAAVDGLHRIAAEAHKICGGRLMRRETLHLTLAFLGDIPGDRVADAMRVAETISVEPFEVTLDRVGYWKHNRILWAGGESPWLTFLADALDTGLRTAGFSLDTRPFSPHVTLLRDARCAATPVLQEPLAWRAKEFVLAESQRSSDGARYEIVSRWPLVQPG